MIWLKRLAMVLGVLLVLAVALVVVFFYVLHPKSRDAPKLTAPNTPEAIARGDYLANHVLGCALCHSPIDETKPGDEILAGQLFAGRVFPVKDMDFPGTLNAPNLTPDKTAGIGAWTDGELARAIREGVDRQGKTLFPMMPYTRFKRLTDEDTLAVIAYLRSVPPLTSKVPKSEIDFPVSMFVRLAPAPLSASPPAWPTDPAERGKILLEVMSCIDCHTPFAKGKLDENFLYAGGNKFKGPFGAVYSANITSDQATGIGAYSDEDLLRVFKEGKGKDGRTLWVMPWRALQGTKEEDLRALIAGLRTLKPIQRVVHGPELKN
jgi:hypothetical protein